jgi:catalase
MGFTSFPEPRTQDDHKVRGNPERFAEHYAQATLFWNSQTPVERQHIVNAFRFELSRVQTPAIRERMVSGLLHVSKDLAQAVATGLGLRALPEPMPKATTRDVTPEVTRSPGLSLLARPGTTGIATRRIAVLVADGCDSTSIVPLIARLKADGAVARVVAPSLGTVTAEVGDDLAVDASLETSPSVLYDAVIVADGDASARALQADGRAQQFVRDQYRHCKPMLALGAGSLLFIASGVAATLPNGEADPGVLVADDGSTAADDFIAALAKHRHFERETDPPRL